MNARAILDGALGITIDILSGNTADIDGQQAKHSPGEWVKNIPCWRKAVSSLLPRATKLRSFSASQPGQGLGGSLDNPSGPSPPPAPGALAYDRILHQRHQTLLIKRTNLEKQASSQLQVQANIIDIARKMKELSHRQTAIEDTKRVLRKAIDVMVAMQDQVRQLTTFFNVLASIISILCQGQAETYLRIIKAGMV